MRLTLRLCKLVHSWLKNSPNITPNDLEAHSQVVSKVHSWLKNVPNVTPNDHEAHLQVSVNFYFQSTCQLKTIKNQMSFFFTGTPRVHLCMFLALKSTLGFWRPHRTKMVARFFASCACAAMPADARRHPSTPCSVRSRGRKKPLVRTRARGLWKKLRPVFGAALPWPSSGAKMFFSTKSQSGGLTFGAKMFFYEISKWGTNFSRQNVFLQNLKVGE